MDTSLIYTVTAVHNRRRITESYIHMIRCQKDVKVHMIIVDDGSTDGTEEMIHTLESGATIIQGDGSLYWGGALQKAFEWIKKHAVEDSLVFISNDDIMIDERFLSRMKGLLEKKPNGLISGWGIGNISRKAIDIPVYWDYVRFRGVPISESHRKANCASTRSLLMSRETFLDVGGFRPVLLPHYRSDYEWTMRACKKGHPIVSREILSYDVSEATTGDAKNRSITAALKKGSFFNPMQIIAFFVLVTPLKFWLPAVGYQIIRLLGRIRKSVTGRERII